MIKVQKRGKRLLALPFHHSGNLRQSEKHLFRIVGDFRTAKPDDRLRQDLFDLPHQLLHIIQIPDIAGKAQKFRLLPVQIHQDLINLLVDRIFRNLRLTQIVFCISP